MRFVSNHFWGIILGIIIAELHRKKMSKGGPSGGGY